MFETVITTITRDGLQMPGHHLRQIEDCRCALSFENYVSDAVKAYYFHLRDRRNIWRSVIFDVANMIGR